MTQTFEGTEDELVRRHRAAVRVVWAVAALIVLLLFASGVAAVYKSLRPPTFSELLRTVLPHGGAVTGPNPTVIITLWVSVIFLGLGSIFYRRTKFSALRLQAVASLGGASGLLRTLQKTTTVVALIGGLIAALGGVSTLLSGDHGDLTRAGLIGLAVLFYAYPRRAAWRRVLEATTEGPGAGDDAAAAKGTTA